MDAVHKVDDMIQGAKQLVDSQELDDIHQG